MKRLRRRLSRLQHKWAKQGPESDAWAASVREHAERAAMVHVRRREADIVALQLKVKAMEILMSLMGILFVIAVVLGMFGSVPSSFQS